MYLCIRVISGTVEDYEDLRDYPTSRRAARRAGDHFVRARAAPTRTPLCPLIRMRFRFPDRDPVSRPAGIPGGLSPWYALVCTRLGVCTGDTPPRSLDALAEIGVGVTYVSRFTCTFVRYFRRYMHNSQYVRFVFVLRVFEIHADCGSRSSSVGRRLPLWLAPT